MKKDYALYKGDTFLELGSRKKLAEYLKVSLNTITFYMSPTYKKRAKNEYSNRLIVFRIEDDIE